MQSQKKMKNETGIAEKEIVTPDGVIHKTQRVNILDQSNGVYVVEVQETKQIIKNIQPAGVCFVKNDNANNIGKTNHQIFELVLIAKMKERTAITDKQDDWWST